MLFTEWLGKQTDRPDPIGDVARDMAHDIEAGCFPGEPTGWPDAVAHVVVEHAPVDAAFDALWSAVTEHVAGLDGPGRLAEHATTWTVLAESSPLAVLVSTSINRAAEVTGLADALRRDRP
jgi:hypothetical protein